MRFLFLVGFLRPCDDVTEVLRKILVLVILGDDEGVLRVVVAAVPLTLLCPVTVTVLGVDCVLCLRLCVSIREALPDDEAQRLLLGLIRLTRIPGVFVLTFIRVDWTSVGGTFIAALRES